MQHSILKQVLLIFLLVLDQCLGLGNLDQERVSQEWVKASQGNQANQECNLEWGREDQEWASREWDSQGWAMDNRVKGNKVNQEWVDLLQEQQ
jgi:hypothetical protein